MRWQDDILKKFQLYAITDLKTETFASLEKVEQACRGGADIVQLRSKILSDAAFIRLGLKIRGITRRYRKLFFVNDRVDLALVMGADGVHLGQEDMPVALARKMIQQNGRSLWIGKSTHNLQQAFDAEKEPADYIGVGPIFSTPTKPGVAPVGLELLRQVGSRIRIPWVAIGGINLKNIHAVMDAGATRIAAVRSVFAAKNTEKAAHELKKILLCHCEKAQRVDVASSEHLAQKFKWRSPRPRNGARDDLTKG